MPDSLPEVFVRALQTMVGAGTDDPSTLFTEDVRAWSPALMASSLAELTEDLKARDDALSNVTVAIRSLNVGDGNEVWLLSVGGATFAEFRGDKIEAFRSYFDEMAVMEQLLVPD